MLNDQHISVVIPALNEEGAIGLVVSEVLSLRNQENQQLIDDVVVCDNGSTDRTAEVAMEQGARVVTQPTPGYGIACLTAIAHLKSTDIVLFIDGDHSCVTDQALRILKPFSIHSQTDLVIGSRTLGVMEAGSLTLPQRFGTALATFLIRGIWGARVTDLGPFRAIRFQALKQLNMNDTTFGWTVEMQVKAIQQDLTMEEVPVDSIRRIGVSKISGTVKGVIGAGIGIVSMIGRLWWAQKYLLLKTYPFMGKENFKK